MKLTGIEINRVFIDLSKMKYRKYLGKKIGKTFYKKDFHYMKYGIVKKIQEHSFENECNNNKDRRLKVSRCFI